MFIKGLFDKCFLEKNISKSHRLVNESHNCKVMFYFLINSPNADLPNRYIHHLKETN